MPMVTFVQADGVRREVELRLGQSLMRACIEANVEGIQADCGGCLSCATCHIYLESSCPLPEPNADELDMLEAVAAPRRASSRLSCQVHVNETLEGAVITIPETQS